MSAEWCCAVPGGVRLAVQIAANAKKTEIMGVFDGMLKIRLQAQPIEGKANEALVRYLAQALGVSRSAVTLTHGQTSKRKLLVVKSAILTPQTVARTLSAPGVDS